MTEQNGLSDEQVALSVQYEQDDIDSVVKAMQEIHSHRQYISDIVSTLKDDQKNVKIFKKVCKAEFEKSFPKIKAENELFDLAVEQLYMTY